MANAFVASSVSSYFQLNAECYGLTRTLCSSRITSHHRLLRSYPSQGSASVLSPRGCRHLCFSLVIGATGSCSSTPKPESASRPLYAGRRLPSNPVSGKFVPETRNSSGFDDNSGITTRHREFTCVRLYGPCLPRVSPELCPPRSPPSALNRSSLVWFEVCS